MKKRELKAQNAFLQQENERLRERLERQGRTLAMIRQLAADDSTADAIAAEHAELARLQEEVFELKSRLRSQHTGDSEA